MVAFNYPNGAINYPNTSTHIYIRNKEIKQTVRNKYAKEINTTECINNAVYSCKTAMSLLCAN